MRALNTRQSRQSVLLSLTQPNASRIDGAKHLEQSELKQMQATAMDGTLTAEDAGKRVKLSAMFRELE